MHWKEVIVIFLMLTFGRGARSESLADHVSDEEEAVSLVQFHSDRNLMEQESANNA